jgi:NAD(P)-dependent dehydrogenase (short-subunit alcohol dehydrogenase family)
MQIDAVAAIVTGGASGLGAATARELAGGGARVTIVDQDARGGAALAAEIGGRFAEADITNEDGVTAAIDGAVEAHGPLRILIHCAGIGGPPIRTAGRKGPYPLDVFRKLIEINLIGAFNVTRLAAHAMIGTEPLARGERGVIVNTASINALDGPVGTIAYTAAKAGVVGMTLTLARDLARKGVRACAIAPGNFDTPMLTAAPKEFLDALLLRVPFPNDRFGDPADFARLARHICENVMLNGEVIRLDGAVRHCQTE